jgi:hypothetical protein
MKNLNQLPFLPDQIVKRSLIHDQYGGSRQSGISPSANFPYIFIFPEVKESNMDMLTHGITTTFSLILVKAKVAT